MQQGQITIFLSLILSLLLSLICTAAEAARVEGIALQGKTAMQMAESSLLSQYHSELLEKYDVFFVDGTLGGENFSTERIENWVTDMLSYNLYAEKNLLLGNRISFLNSGVSYLEMGDFCLATDAQGYEFYKQAIAYEKNRLGIELLEGLVEQTYQGEEIMTKGKDFENNESEQQEAVNKIEEETKETEHAFSEEALGDSNPLKNVEACKAKGLLSLVMPSNTVSGKKVNQKLLASQRELLVGSGKKEADSFFGGVMDRILFAAYAMEKFHHALSEEKSEGLSYEVEYILIGKDSDKKNLEGVLAKLLIFREGINYAYLHTDTGKMAEAETIAAAIVGFTESPLLISAMRELILMGWAYGESIMDLQSLMKGGSLALVKTSENWQLGLAGIGRLLTDKCEKREETGGLSYGDYLLLLLAIESGDARILRTIDLIETNIRQTKGNEGFRMDSCFSQCTYSLSYGAEPLFLGFPRANHMLQGMDNPYSFSLEGILSYSGFT